MILLDTNVLIEAFKGNAETKAVLQRFKRSDLGLSSITVMELIYGARNNQEVRFIKQFINTLNVLLVNEKVSSEALNLVERFAKSHTLDIPDALIASTALTENCELFTYNLKDFRFIPGLRLFKA